MFKISREIFLRKTIFIKCSRQRIICRHVRGRSSVPAADKETIIMPHAHHLFYHTDTKRGIGKIAYTKFLNKNPYLMPPKKLLGEHYYIPYIMR